MIDLSFIIDVSAGLLLGAAIGLERQWRQRLAGLRTNALVALGAAAFVAISTIHTVTMPGSDPTRVAAQVVSGIGFLGGGLILKEGFTVRGLNTAATLWCSAAVGSLAGLGALVPATATAALVLAANILLRPVVQMINRQPLEHAAEIETCYQIDIHCRPRVESHLRTSLLQEAAGDSLLMRSMKRETLPESAQLRLIAELVTQGRNDRLVERIASRLGLESGVSSISWSVHPHTESA